VWVATGAGAIELLTVQPSGKRPLDAADWWRGLKETARARLGE
jgi:methionyl-tRNA formyltransferase